MKKLIIAIDCDDVLIPATEYLVRTYNEMYGTKVQLDDAFTSGNPQWMAERAEVYRRLQVIQAAPEYARIKPNELAVRVVKELATHHELHLVTARDGSIMEVTMQMIDAYYPNCFQTIEHVGADRPKGKVCRAVSADVIIDDNLQHLVSARGCGIENLIWFGDYPWQHQTEQVPARTIQCSDWSKVGEEIERLAN